jgi:hypothetical protein
MEDLLHIHSLMRFVMKIFCLMERTLIIYNVKKIKNLKEKKIVSEFNKN